jgi:hypothetical protein
VAARRKSYGNIKCKKIYPIVNTTKQVSELKTVAFQPSAGMQLLKYMTRFPASNSQFRKRSFRKAKANYLV